MGAGDFCTAPRALRPGEADVLLKPGVRTPRAALAKMAGRPLGQVVAFTLPTTRPMPVAAPKVRTAEAEIPARPTGVSLDTAVHLKAIYYLPTWQGGDVTLPRCRIGTVGHTAMPGKAHELTEYPGAVTCPCCRTILACGSRPRGSND